MKRLNIIALFLSSCTILALNNSKANNTITPKVYSGIEIGSKGVKWVVLEVLDNKLAAQSFTGIKDSSINTNIINFNDDAYTKTLEAITLFYKKAHEMYSVDDNCIYITISSGIVQEAKKSNKDAFIEELRKNCVKTTENNKLNWDVVSPELESEMSFISLIPEAAKQETLLLNFGSSNVKGGFYSKNQTDFMSFSQGFGGSSLNKHLSNTLPKDYTTLQYFVYLNRAVDSVKANEIISIFDSKVGFVEKRNIVVSGGIAWALNNLIMPDQSKKDFLEVSHVELNKIIDILKSNFDAKSLDPNLFTNNIEDKDDKEIANKKLEAVLKVFDAKALLCGTKLVQAFVQTIETKQRKAYILLTQFGASGWLPGYIQSKNYVSE